MFFAEIHACGVVERVILLSMSGLMAVAETVPLLADALALVSAAMALAEIAPFSSS